MEEHTRSGLVIRASAKAGVHRNTGSKYLRLGELPSMQARERHWRTRGDPFAAVWDEVVVPLVADAPELEGKTIFSHLCLQFPGRFQEGQIRTLQRRLRLWRAQHGPPREVMFSQVHPPGEAIQTDFTWMTDLEITIARQAFRHMLCHVVLPHSNWQWATVCHSESMDALQIGVQAGLWRLGRVPEWHQTDNSTAATHRVVGGSGRPFNERYLALMRHLGMKPRTIEVGKKNQNGDVEALNGALKRRINQHLLLRRSRDFESVAAYESWLEGVLELANSLRSQKLADELAVMRELRVKALPAYREFNDVLVTSWSTIRVLKNTYSVPSRLIGERVRVRAHPQHLEILYAGGTEVKIERLPDRTGHRINYRDVIWSLVQKPGAFRSYRYRADLFPTVEFRLAYDQLVSQVGDRKADVEYLRILHLAASTMESEVETALALLRECGHLPNHEAVKAWVQPHRPTIPQLLPLQADLGAYDELLASGGEV